MSTETIPNWPRLEATLNPDGTASVTIGGLPRTIEATTIEAAREEVLELGANHADQLGRGLRAVMIDPDGHWPLVIYPDGQVDVDTTYVLPPEAANTSTGEPETIETDEAKDTATTWWLRGALIVAPLSLIALLGAWMIFTPSHTPNASPVASTAVTQPAPVEVAPKVAETPVSNEPDLIDIEISVKARRATPATGNGQLRLTLTATQVISVEVMLRHKPTGTERTRTISVGPTGTTATVKKLAPGRWTIVATAEGYRHKTTATIKKPATPPPSPPATGPPAAPAPPATPPAPTQPTPQPAPTPPANPAAPSTGLDGGLG